jgi:hypothetical protein
MSTGRTCGAPSSRTDLVTWPNRTSARDISDTSSGCRRRGCRRRLGSRYPGTRVDPWVRLGGSTPGPDPARCTDNALRSALLIVTSSNRRALSTHLVMEIGRGHLPPHDASMVEPGRRPAQRRAGLSADACAASGARVRRRLRHRAPDRFGGSPRQGRDQAVTEPRSAGSLMVDEAALVAAARGDGATVAAWAGSGHRSSTPWQASAPANRGAGAR